MSRSPSKFLARTGSEISRHGSPQSPCRRFGSTPLQQRQLASYPQSAPPAAATTSSTTPHLSPAFTPLRSSVKLSLRSAKSAKTSTPSRLARTRASPKSPLKRALSATPDSGNSGVARPSSLSSPGARLMEQENHHTISLRSTPRKGIEKSSRHSFHLDVTGAAQQAFLKALDVSADSQVTSTTGALKRSDATMNLDRPNQGSPVAKRRSLHGVANPAPTEEQNVFSTSTIAFPTFDIHEDTFAEYELSGAGSGTQHDSLSSPPPPPPVLSNIPKRSSSLRKSTLQQRYGDKNSWGRRTGERQLAQMSGEFSTPVRSRPRLSTDHFIPPPPPRDNPFTAGSPFPAPALFNVDNKSHQPHPLSKTLTTSTSGNSLTEETSLYAPAKVADRPRPHPFSRSLPLNATRPLVRPALEHSKVVATPNHGHQLWIGAFNSTGLISKVNRNPEDGADKKLAPPDTPCKKHSNPFATFPQPAGSAMKRRVNSRSSFAGMPSTPFNPILGRTPDTFGNPGKGLSIFQRGSASNSARRASILSMEMDDRKLFGDNVDLINSLDGDVPPTPTKNTLTPSLSNLSENSLESPSANRTFPALLSAARRVPSREPSCKLTLQSPSESKDEVDEAYCRASQPTLSTLTTQSSTPPKISQLPLYHTQTIYAKMMFDNIASPLNGRRTPHTPQESLLPIDTSRLSISQAGEGLGDNGMPPPVTPTTARDLRSSASIFVTPVNARTSNLDIDASLYSRFDKVEQIGKGEFSTVYRVTKLDHQSAFNMITGTPSDDPALSPSKGQVFAVKKSKQPYQGPKDRDMKLREVRTLQALSHAEHVVQYVDDWEHNFHLYIQTEFCEEGTLDKFLSNVGRGGRLDDFRIYKILQDLCLVSTYFLPILFLIDFANYNCRD